MFKFNDIQDFDYMIMFKPHDHDTVTLELMYYNDDLERMVKDIFIVNKEILEVLNVREFLLYQADSIIDADLNIICPNRDNTYEAEKQFAAISQLRDILIKYQTMNNKDKEYLYSLNQDGLEYYVSDLYTSKETRDVLNKYNINFIWELLLIDQSILHAILIGNENVNEIRKSLNERGYNLRDTVKVVSGQKIDRKELNNTTHEVIDFRSKYHDNKTIIIEK